MQKTCQVPRRDRGESAPNRWKRDLAKPVRIGSRAVIGTGVAREAREGKAKTIKLMGLLAYLDGFLSLSCLDGMDGIRCQG